MCITDEQAMKLLNLSKMVFDEGVLKQEINFPLSEKTIKFKCYLKSTNEEFGFLLSVQQGLRESYKFSLHLQENMYSSPVGLLRIDYGNSSPHTNPAIAKDSVPKFALPYVGKEIRCNHAHFYVTGYKPLAWAVPLDVFDFPVKEISDFESFENAVRNFADKINLRTRLLLERRLYL